MLDTSPEIEATAAHLATNCRPSESSQAASADHTLHLDVAFQL